MKTLKEIRKSRRMSRRKVAHILRIPTICYTVYEKLPQRIPYPVAAKISAVFGVCLDDIDFG